MNSLGKQYYLSGIGIQSGSWEVDIIMRCASCGIDGQWREYNDTTVRTVENHICLNKNPIVYFIDESK